VTVGSTAPTEMLPRLRFLPAPYAFTATSANQIVNPGGTPVLTYANNRVEVAGDFYASGGIVGNGSGLTGLSTAQLGSGTLADARLSANVALRAGGNAFTGNQTIGGNLGLGTLGTAFPLTIGNNTLGDKISLWGQSGNSYGFGIQGGTLQIHSASGGDDIAFGYGSSAVMTETMRIKGNGNLGLGTTQPGARLSLVAPGASEVQGSAMSATLRTSAGTLGTTAGNELALASIGFHSANNSSLGVRAVRVANGSDWTSTAIVLGMDVDNTVRAGGASLYLQANGHVGVSGSNPLELGTGVAGKEANAGKIGYQTFTAGALDIVGAGTTGGPLNRRVKIWAEGGAEFAGRVGIGTATPAVPLDVNGNATLSMTDNGYISGQGTWNSAGTIYTLVNAPNGGSRGPEVYGMEGGNGSSGPRSPAPTYVGSVAIRANGGYIASSMGLVVYSDRRIKRDAQPSEATKDLAAIQKIKVMDYRMVDPADGGTGWRKGFIAQEVEQVIPGAVTGSVEFVPDIFSLATNVVFHAPAKTLSVSLTKDHGLKTGDRVRLHVDGTRLDANVSAVPSSHEFVVDKWERAPEKVFVYGRQVNDFRTVDYDRIFTTGIGAIQELARKVEELESRQSRLAEVEKKASRTDALDQENADLRARLDRQDKRLAVLESLIREKLNGVRQAGLRAADIANKN
ncbi:MAG: tail fiber domain-containing protein, partial [Verrucomicrobiales bacterium]|nr:tail fiber domain-containing protein [Verrucomicrobiales bacterium]